MCRCTVAGSLIEASMQAARSAREMVKRAAGCGRSRGFAFVGDDGAADLQNRRVAVLRMAWMMARRAGLHPATLTGILDRLER
jgi:hypothetical protein